MVEHRRIRNSAGEFTSYLSPIPAAAPSFIPRRQEENPPKGARPSLEALGDYESERNVAKSTDDPATLRALASHTSPSVRAAVAGNQATPTDVLEVLSFDEASAVQLFLASNPSASDSAVKRVVGLNKTQSIKRIAQVRQRQKRASSGLSTRPQPVQLNSDLPAGRNHYDPSTERCLRCDSRYCTTCQAGERGYLYVTGLGWVGVFAARQQAEAWSKAGLSWGPHHPVRRIEVVCGAPNCRICS